MTAPCKSHSRRDVPITLADMIYTALWLADGETVAFIARRLERPIPQVRAMINGDPS